MKQLIIFAVFVIFIGAADAAPKRYTKVQYEVAHLKANQRHLAEHERCQKLKRPAPCFDVNDALWRKDQARIYARKVGTPHARAEASRVIHQQDKRMRQQGLIP